MKFLTEIKWYERVSPSGVGGIILPAMLTLAGLLVLSTQTRAQTEIARTVHNLTPSSVGALREADASGLCVFCHTPHNARPTVALWNRELPGVTYTLYESSTLQATLYQPTGASRLCLSCHDGILALSNLRVPPKGSHFTLGPLTGKASLGTDLSDDHPISFVYNGALAIRQGELVDPSALPSKVHLDNTGQLQCTTCHDPHEDRLPNFMRIDNRFGALCTACHKLRNWSDSSHFTSSATWKGSAPSPWPDGAFPTVAENACLNCHRSHAAGHPQRLLAQSTEPANCTVCHNGAVADKNIDMEFVKPFAHPINSSQWVHDPKEEPALMPRHVTCVDCHNPHAVTSTTTQPPLASGRLRGVRGVTIGGGRIDEANYEYEVCLKCHGMAEPTTPGNVRQDNTRNIRLKINPTNPSYHPVAAPGMNATILGLLPGYTSASQISCTSCHNNDEWTPTGIVPRGPHGSRFESILEQEFQAGDPATESSSSYALCYKCHDRTTLLTGGVGQFPHNTHVVVQNTSCDVCHDPHGSRQYIRLINFMRFSKFGNAVVNPSTTTGQLQFVPDPGRPGHGNCSLNCHGSEHNARPY
jgi:predicted CXXCH cytochrome family protein